MGYGIWKWAGFLLLLCRQRLEPVLPFFSRYFARRNFLSLDYPQRMDASMRFFGSSFSSLLGSVVQCTIARITSMIDTRPESRHPVDSASSSSPFFPRYALFSTTSKLQFFALCSLDRKQNVRTALLVFTFDIHLFRSQQPDRREANDTVYENSP